MSADFDPYQEWLSIPQNERPANYYRLLGLPLFESNLNVISNAADRQMAFVRTFQTGPYSQQSQQILNELAQARITLLDKQKKAQYDAKLRTSAYTTPPNLTPSGAIGEMQSAPPPSASSLTPQPWSNNSVSGSKSHVTPPGNTTVPPVPDSTNPTLAFLKKHWIAVLIALVAVQFIVCGGGLLAYLLKPSSTQIAQNQTTQQTQKEDEKAAPSEAQRLAEQYYKQSVDLQEKENYDEALSKITVAVELQPENEVYKAQQQALTRLIKSLGKTKKTSGHAEIDESEDESETELPFPAEVNTDDNDPAPGRSDDTVQLPTANRPAKPASITKEEAEVRLKAEAEAKFKAEQEAKRQFEIKRLQENIRQAEVAHNEAVQFQKEGKYAQAAEKIDEAVKLDPENEQYKEEKAQIDNQVKADDAYKESVDLEEKGQYAEALVKIEDALELDPNNEDYINQKMDIQTTYYKQYVQYRIAREYLKALTQIDKAIELVPTEDFYKEEKQKTEEIVKNIEDGFEVPKKDPDYADPEEEPEPEKPRGFEPGKEAGERKTVDVDGMEIAFRWCPAGTFTMGSPTSEAGRKADEKQHEVELTKGFWIMETEITVGMFKAFVNDTGYKSKGLKPWGISNGKWNQNADYSWLNPGFAQNDASPVTCISWKDAVAFSKWLGTKIDSKASLPTEAQWEYACRAGSETAYFWGNALNGDKANCNGNYPCGTSVKGPYLERSTHAGNYNSNPWGISDMHGNVWEWCRDGYSGYPSGKVTDPYTPAKGAKRVFRGGSWSFYAERCRSAYRANFVAAIRLPNIGGRCVVEPSGDEPASVKNKSENKAGDRAVKTINGVEFAFRWCPPGTFMMGSPTSEDGRYDDETQHRVTLTKGFWMMETEVTQKQWKAVMGDNPSDFQGDDLPVENVSWNDSKEFCRKCSALGLPVRLPTEAQWEYACRADSTTAYFWGNALNGDKANCNGNYPCGTTTKGKYIGKTTPVGSYQPNAWGLYDMHGNVWEWCADWYDDYPSGSVTDPTGPSNGSRRVRRGGSWDSYARNCRSAGRRYYEPAYRDGRLGFRVVSSVDLESSKTKEIKTNDNKETETVVPQGDLGVGKNAGDRVVKTINGVEFAFRWCPAGTFMMGSPTGEEGRWDKETQHEVTLTKGFWMLETEVTQKQWKAVMGNLPDCGFKGDDLPVERVSWNDCQDFCKKCTQLGLPVQLPTEAQWEYACRAGTTGAYAGSLDEMAWYGYYSTPKGTSKEETTHPVGTKKPNAWGLYDMHGNVWEWCADWYDDYPSGSVTDPTGPSNGSNRVDRGGSWYSFAQGCRSAFRSYFEPDYRRDLLGFRVVRGQ